MGLAAVEGTDGIGHVVGRHEAEADTYGSVERGVANMMACKNLNYCIGTQQE